MIILNNVDKSFSGTEVLRDIKLEISDSSIYGLVGYNGAGKTTSIGKISKRLKLQGKTVVVAAADTFRAAAIDQLAVWCERSGVELVKQNEGSDPAAVVFDAISYAKRRGADVLIIDTAGRLHNKKNLMNELKKIDRIIEREYPDAYRENLIVLDGTTGQNALQQVKLFKEVADIQTADTLNLPLPTAHYTNVVIKPSDLQVELVKSFSQNWEKDRIAVMDMSIMQAAIAEINFCPTIPVNVTLNEFIEISKYYSSEKSSLFINGILDRVVNKYKEDSSLLKVGMFVK